jgi:hypothetical protein
VTVTRVASSVIVVPLQCELAHVFQRSGVDRFVEEGPLTALYIHLEHLRDNKNIQ